MDPVSKQRLWGVSHALDNALVRGFLVALAMVLVIVPILIWLPKIAGKSSPEKQ
jgi:NADH:ubiquinone oxidoreductase subunit 4 (subunit M)